MRSSAHTSVTIALALLLGLSAIPEVRAQTPAGDPYAEDVASLDAIIHALYDVISGPAGEVRDWDRFRHLFHPDAGQLVGMGLRPDGDVVHRAMTPDDYVERSGPTLETDGFFETEIGGEEHRFGNMAHVFSAYAARRDPGDLEPFVRGINSIQALWDGERWWIVSVLWDSERPDNLIPERYVRGR